MVRISDILKQRGQSKESPPPKEEAKESTEKPTEPEKPVEGLQVTKAMAKEEPDAENQMQVAGAMHQMQINPEESRIIYAHALQVISEILNKTKQDAPVDLREAYEITKVMVDRVVLGDKELIALTVNYSEDNYLYAHSVNVCVISIYVGLNCGYNKSKILELSLGAFLHDLGMIKVIDIASAPRPLNETEFQEVKKHPIYSANILNKIKDIQEEVLYIAQQTHERLNGKGYPHGLKSDKIHEYSKIVATIDVYEALTHPRPYHQPLQPHEAIRELLSINSTGFFEPPILKTLINAIGLYPIGSWVELNTGEIAKVISSNEDAPLRPKVNIIFGANKERLLEMKSVDLLIRSNLFIKHSVNLKELDLKLE